MQVIELRPSRRLKLANAGVHAAAGILVLALAGYWSLLIIPIIAWFYRRVQRRLQPHPSGFLPNSIAWSQGTDQLGNQRSIWYFPVGAGLGPPHILGQDSIVTAGFCVLNWQPDTADSQRAFWNIFFAQNRQTVILAKDSVSDDAWKRLQAQLRWNESA